MKVSVKVYDKDGYVMNEALSHVRDKVSGGDLVSKYQRCRAEKSRVKCNSGF